MSCVRPHCLVHLHFVHEGCRVHCGWSDVGMLQHDTRTVPFPNDNPPRLTHPQYCTGSDVLGGWLAAAAALERLSRALGDASAAATATLQPVADALGSALGLPPDDTELFAEEVFVQEVLRMTTS